jgi:hypothetical protein
VQHIAVLISGTLCPIRLVRFFFAQKSVEVSLLKGKGVEKMLTQAIQLKKGKLQSPGKAALAHRL